MPNIYCGFDFGTSNTVVTVINPAGEILAIVADASVLFLPDSGAYVQERFVGREAVERYVASGMDGRFIQSIKTVLPDSAFRGTDIYGKTYRAEELVAMILNHFKTKIESELGIAVNGAVFGRPVEFSPDPERDALAEGRLQEAAERTGFHDIAFEYEPVAAATRFASLLESDQTVLVCDFGGGTSDFSVIRVAKDGSPHIPANRGVRVGGDDFDGEIMWNRLTPYFGFGSQYESYGKMLPVPVHVYQALRQWDRIAFLKTAQYREDLRYIHAGAADKLAIEWLMKLIDDDLAYALFQAIRDAKHQLSDEPSAAISFFERGIELKERLYYDEFEEYVAGEIADIVTAIRTVLEDANVMSEEIRAVFMTGGSSFARPIRNAIEELFPDATVRTDSDRFQSVSLGLAWCAQQSGVVVS